MTGGDELPVLIGLKTEIAPSAKFLETNDPLYSRIRRTHRVQNELKEKQSRSTLALYLGTLENAVMLRVRSALETRGHTPIALIFDGVLFLENQPLSDDALQDLCDEVGVTVCAKELAWAPPRGDGQSLWERLRARGSASGPMPVACDAIPDHACLVSACSMLPTNREITADMPPGPFTYREAQELLGVRFNPAVREDLASGGAFVLHHSDHAVGLDVSPSPSGKRLDAVTVYDGNFADTWHTQLSDVLEVLSSGETVVPHVLFRVQSGNGEGCEDPSLDLRAGSGIQSAQSFGIRAEDGGPAGRPGWLSGTWFLRSCFRGITAHLIAPPLISPAGVLLSGAEILHAGANGCNTSGRNCGNFSSKLNLKFRRSLLSVQFSVHETPAITISGSLFWYDSRNTREQRNTEF